LGAFDFNSRYYADDDLVVGSADPFQLFRIMVEIVLVGAHRPESGVNFMLDQCHNIILDSLAVAFADAISDAERLSGQPIEVVHVVGGGAQNALLCQLTADAARRPVVAGPVEATALGNLLVQARTHGVLSGDLAALRRRVRAATRLHHYQPRR
jgi:sugar (pentulose or hexulose) kinase